MVDDLFNPWLIEINTSPAMDYSTEITERMVKEMSEDLIKVVIDLPNKKRKINELGNFSLIYSD